MNDKPNYPLTTTDGGSEANVIAETITRQYAVPSMFLFDQILVVYRQRKQIFWIVLVLGTLLSVLIGFSMPEVYNATIIFETRAATSSAASSITSALGLSSDPSNEITLRLSSAYLARSFIVQNKILKELETCHVVPFFASCPKNLGDAVLYFNNTVKSVAPGATPESFQMVVSWRDAKTAAAWANGVVDLLNDQMRTHEIVERQTEVQNYSQEVAKMNMVQMLPAIYNNLSSAENALVVARSTPDYGVIVIDPAVPPEHGGHQAFFKVLVAGFALSLVLAFFSMYMVKWFPLPHFIGSVGSWTGRLQEKWRKAM